MPELNERQFAVLAKILRSKGASKEAVRLVLVDGKTITEAVAATSVLQPAVSRSVARYREQHRLILEGYDFQK